MLYYNLALAIAAAASTANAQRPSDTPICDYYTTALLKENTAANQATLLTLVVNTVVIGNYTQPNVGIKVPGILAPGEVNGEKVNLMGYFNGEMAIANRGGSKGTKVNFLDGGGAEPLKKNKPADDEDSNQYFLLTHLYEFFGGLLGCSMQGMKGFDAYTASPSMYQVHKFMGLDSAQVTYFVQQVGMAAASFGVADDDVKAVGDALNSLFNVRCAPPTAAIPAQGKKLQSICIAKDCPLAKDDMCSAYDNQDSSSSMATPSMSPTATSTSKPTTVPSDGAATANSLGLAAVALGIAAFAL